MEEPNWTELITFCRSSSGDYFIDFTYTDKEKFTELFMAVFAGSLDEIAIETIIEKTAQKNSGFALNLSEISNQIMQIANSINKPSFEDNECEAVIPANAYSLYHRGKR